MLEVLIHDWLPLMILSGEGGAAGCGKTNSSIDEDYKMSKGPAVHIKGMPANAQNNKYIHLLRFHQIPCLQNSELFF